MKGVNGVRFEEERKRERIETGVLVTWRWGAKKRNLHFGIVIDELLLREPDIGELFDAPVYDVLWASGSVEQFSATELCLIHVVHKG